MKNLDYFIELAKKHRDHKVLIEPTMLIKTKNNLLRRFIMIGLGLFIVSLALNYFANFNSTNDNNNISVRDISMQKSSNKAIQTPIVLDSSEQLFVELNNNIQKETDTDEKEEIIIKSKEAKNKLKKADNELIGKSNVIEEIIPLKMIELKFKNFAEIFPEYVPENNTFILTSKSQVESIEEFNKYNLEKYGYKTDEIPSDLYLANIFEKSKFSYRIVQSKELNNFVEGLYPIFYQFFYSDKNSSGELYFNNLNNDYSFLSEIYSLSKQLSIETSTKDYNLDKIRTIRENYSESIKKIKEKLIPVKIIDFDNYIKVRSFYIWFVPTDKFINRINNKNNTSDILTQFKDENDIISNFNSERKLDIKTQKNNIKLNIELKQDSEVTFGIYDIKGELIRHISFEFLNKGNHSLEYKIDNFEFNDLMRIVAIDKNNNIIANYY